MFERPRRRAFFSVGDMKVKRSKLNTRKEDGDISAPIGCGVETVEVDTGAVPQEQKAQEAELVKSVQRELDRQGKKTFILTKLSAIWTLISTVYAIASTCLFIARGWLSNAVSIVLACILAVYVAVFITLAIMTFKDFKSGKKRVKLYKKTLKIFKAAANIILLSITAVSMVGMSVNGLNDVAKLIAFIITFVVAVIQLGLSVSLLIMKLFKSYITKKFKVEIVRFVDGKKKKKSVAHRLQENKYKGD